MASSRNPFQSTPEQGPELHQKMVAVVTHFGNPVSIGRIRVHPAAGKAAPRIEVVFHTENVSCAITVEPQKLEPVAPHSDGIHYRYRLPAGDELWSPSFGPRKVSEAQVAAPPLTPAETGEAQIETYPLPPDYRLTGYSTTTPARPQSRDSQSPQPSRRMLH